MERKERRGEEEEERKSRKEKNLIPSRRTERPSVMVWDGAGRGWREQSRPVRAALSALGELDGWLRLGGMDDIASSCLASSVLYDSICCSTIFVQRGG